MNIITVDASNLEREHICCAISNNNDCQVAAKKAWLAARLADGLVFKKGDVRGKCFIEYIPAEKAWAPVDADGYTYIDCLWVSGQFKGHGWSNLLLDECIGDSKSQGRLGLVAISSPKKLPFMSDPKYMRYKGFAVADTAAPYFELLYLPFGTASPVPRFKPCVKMPTADGDGFVLYYTHQCPFTAKYVPVVEMLAREKGVPFRAVRFDTAAEAQSSPSPFTAYSLFYNGAFVTHEILSDKKFAQIIADKCGK